MAYTYPIAVVTWLDAVEHSDGSVAPRHAAATQITCGWLLRYDDKGVSIAFEYSDDDGSWRGEAFIPAGMIVSVYEISVE